MRLVIIGAACLAMYSRSSSDLIREVSEWEKELLRMERIWRYPTPKGDGYIYDFPWGAMVRYCNGECSALTSYCITTKGWEQCLREAHRAPCRS